MGRTRKIATKLLDRARRMRHDMTDAERTLWYALRDRRFSQTKFARQYPIGPYIADFICRSRNLIVEVDGGQHARQGDKDDERTAYLNRAGYRVIRFWNNEVLDNIDAVLVRLAQALSEPD